MTFQLCTIKKTFVQFCVTVIITDILGFRDDFSINIKNLLTAVGKSVENFYTEFCQLFGHLSTGYEQMWINSVH